MGGFGSHGHRTFPDAKNTTDQYHVLDIRQWSRDGLLDKPEPFNFDWILDGRVAATARVKIENDDIYISPIYHIGDNQFHSKQQRIEVWYERYPGTGYRAFFLCPGCLHRKCLLYCADSFLCKTCLHLVHRCTRETTNDLDKRRYAKACAKINSEPYTYGMVDRPRYMHETTFKRLRRACNESEQIMNIHLVEERDKMIRALGLRGDAKLHGGRTYQRNPK